MSWSPIYVFIALLIASTSALPIVETSLNTTDNGNQIVDYPTIPAEPSASSNSTEQTTEAESITQIMELDFGTVTPTAVTVTDEETTTEGEVSPPELEEEEIDVNVEIIVKTPEEEVLEKMEEHIKIEQEKIADDVFEGLNESSVLNPLDLLVPPPENKEEPLVEPPMSIEDLVKQAREARGDNLVSITNKNNEPNITTTHSIIESAERRQPKNNRNNKFRTNNKRRNNVQRNKNKQNKLKNRRRGQLNKQAGRRRGRFQPRLGRRGNRLLSGLPSGEQKLMARATDTEESEGDEGLSFTSRLIANIQDEVSLGYDKANQEAKSQDSGILVGSQHGAAESPNTTT